MLREVVEEHDITPDDLLYKMRKKVSDEPLNFN